MVPQDVSPDPDADARDVFRTDLRNSLCVIRVRAQIIQKQILRADGLLNLERDQLLSGLVALRTEALRLEERLEQLIAFEEQNATTQATSVIAQTEPPR